MIHNKKIIVIIVIITILVIFACFLIFNRDNEVEVSIYDDLTEDMIASIVEKENKLQVIDNLSDYYFVKKVLNKYFMNYKYIYTEDNSDGIYTDSLYGLLGKEYIEENQLNKEDIRSIVSDVRNLEFFMTEGYYLTNSSGKTIYFINGFFVNLETNTLNDFLFMIKYDEFNNTVALYPDEYVKNMELGELKAGSEVNISFDYSIENNNFNSVIKTEFTTDDYAEDIFESTRKIILYSTDRAYNMLEEDFKKENFPTYEDFEKFVNENRRNIYIMTYQDYDLKYIDENTTQYIVYDSKDNFYLKFYVDSLIDFKFTIEEY